MSSDSGTALASSAIQSNGDRARRGRLAGNVAIVTGGTRGLGLAMAAAFLQEGASVICAARREAPLAELKAAHGDRVSVATVDVCSADSVRSLMDGAMRRFGRVDILVSNAGVSRNGKIVDLGEREWREVLDTNLTGAFHCTKYVVPCMEAAGGGRIINISAGMSSRVAPGAAAYSASKAALEMFTRASAVELAKKGILVNCIAPGFVNTGMYEPLRDDERLRSRYERMMVSGRPGEPSEVAAAAVFLASAEGSYVNGHVLEVNGGLLWS
ncbi:SDR family NAD(P)-dependent oxidoreductase [Amycolatopsis thermoflava]|uniref:SDR family NAD(P)-dependent oxidoreductase n=1 Tax=Amycolatopsis thermoflava TaxID=84480 RepID=UPI00364E7F54